MGIRFRKSFKVAPGVRLNVGKRGIGTSIGGQGLRVSHSSRGSYIGSSIPGTGVSVYKKVGSRKKRPQRVRYEWAQQQIKQEKIDQAQTEVEKYEAHVAMLTSVHEEASDSVNWRERLQRSRPFSLSEEGPHVQEIMDTIENYQPTWRDRFFNRTEAWIQKWKEQIPEARIADEGLIKDWEKGREIAKGVLQYDLDAWKSVIQEANPFEDIIELGSRISYDFSPTGKTAVIRLDIDNKQVVPNISLSLTKTGKLSQKKMTKTVHFQLYQDYVCSCVLRIAREFFALLPVENVLIHVYDDSSAEESTEYGCILSVNIKRNEFESLYFENIDCSDTIELFEHNMKFLKTKGFKFVQEVGE